MHRLDFREASETVTAVDAELEALLRVVWDQTARERQRDLCFFLAKYPYRHFVFRNGRPLEPDGQPLRADLLVATERFEDAIRYNGRGPSWFAGTPYESQG